MTSQLIQQEAITSIERLINKVSKLESNDYFRPIQRTGVTSNPPSQAEINALFGSAASFNSEVVGLIKDKVNDRVWVVFGDKSSWYYTRIYNSGMTYVPLYNANVVTSDIAFVNGNFAVPGVPTNATGVVISINMTSATVNRTVQVKPTLASTGDYLLVTTQTANRPNQASTTVPTSNVTGSGNVVYCSRSGALTALSIQCTGYFI